MRGNERESFLPFPDRPMKLFRPMADIAVLCTKPSKSEGSQKTVRSRRIRSPFLAALADHHASNERPGTSEKSFGLNVTKVARCIRA
jgi:hypothetical protein